MLGGYEEEIAKKHGQFNTKYLSSVQLKKWNYYQQFSDDIMNISRQQTQLQYKIIDLEKKNAIKANLKTDTEKLVYKINQYKPTHNNFKTIKKLLSSNGFYESKKYYNSQNGTANNVNDGGVWINDKTKETINLDLEIIDFQTDYTPFRINAYLNTGV